jgi:Family of unknown function (DUF6065)
MKKVFAYTSGQGAVVDQLPMHRDWMDTTFDRHAYQCFPLSLSNRLGWGISYPEDITFIWDGINDSTPDHVKIISGMKYVHSNRGNRTISFNTGITFLGENEANVTLLTMPVPNQFVRGAQCMTTLISTSVLESELPIAWMITEPNIEITIPANTPIAAILPISLSEIQEHELEIVSGRPEYQDEDWLENSRKRGDASQAMNSKGEWTHFYRDAVDHNGSPVGNHEAKKIIMKVVGSANN